MRVINIFNVSSSSVPFLMASRFFLFFSIFLNIISFIIVLTPFNEVEAVNLRGCCFRDEIFEDDGNGDNGTKKGGLCVYKNDEENDNNDSDELKNVSSNCDGVLAIVDRDINSSFISVNVDGKMEINSEYNLMKRKNDDDDDEEVCLDIEGSRDKLVLRSCKDIEYCDENLCLRKCCPEHQIYMLEGTRLVCRRTNDTSIQTLAQWHMEFRNVLISLTSKERIEKGIREGYYDTLNTSDYGLLIGTPPICPYGRWSDVTTNDDWHIDSKGVFHCVGKSYDHRNSCIEISRIYNVNTFNTFACHEKNDTESEDSYFSRYTKLTLMLISCVFLLATLLVYGCLTALQNLHGKTVMAYVGSLFFGYLGTAVLTLNFIKDSEGASDKEKYYNLEILCKFLGYATLFFLLSVFAWLNVICYDIWDKFRSLRNSGRSLSDRREAKIRFIYYCIFAWGFGLILTSAAYLSDHSEFLPVCLKPRFGTQRCWFVAIDAKGAKSYSEVLFFFGPVFLQLIFNMILYILTARRCSLVKNEIATRVRADRSNNADKNRDFESDRTTMILSVKLFVVMGIFWIFEILSFVISFYKTQLPTWTPWLLLLPDAVNCLQGVLIFFLFVYKDQVLSALRRKFFRSDSSSSSSFRTWTNRRQTVKNPITRDTRSRSTMTTSSNGAFSSDSAVGDSPL